MVSLLPCIAVLNSCSAIFFVLELHHFVPFAFVQLNSSTRMSCHGSPQICTCLFSNFREWMGMIFGRVLICRLLQCVDVVFKLVVLLLPV